MSSQPSTSAANKVFVVDDSSSLVKKDHRKLKIEISANGSRGIDSVSTLHPVTSLPNHIAAVSNSSSDDETMYKNDNRDSKKLRAKVDDNRGSIRFESLASGFSPISLLSSSSSSSVPTPAGLSVGGSSSFAFNQNHHPVPALQLQQLQQLQRQYFLMAEQIQLQQTHLQLQRRQQQIQFQIHHQEQQQQQQQQQQQSVVRRPARKRRASSELSALAVSGMTAMAAGPGPAPAAVRSPINFPAQNMVGSFLQVAAASSSSFHAPLKKRKAMVTQQQQKQLQPSTPDASSSASLLFSFSQSQPQHQQINNNNNNINNAPLPPPARARAAVSRVPPSSSSSHTPAATTNNNSNYNRPVKQYGWTAAEDDQLRELYQVHGHKWDKWNLIARKMPHRTKAACHLRYQNYLKVSCASTRKCVGWTAEEDEKLQGLHRVHGGTKWELIAKHFPIRTKFACRQRYYDQKSNSEKKKYVAWTAEEDTKLRVFYDEHGGTKWGLIAKSFPLRTKEACKDRYLRYIKDTNEKKIYVAWSREEDVLMKELYTKHGSKWNVIASHLPNRTKSACAMRFNYYKGIGEEAEAKPVKGVNNQVFNEQQQQQYTAAASHPTSI